MVRAGKGKSMALVLESSRASYSVCSMYADPIDFLE